jgi:large subunit ribosomal protein L7A
METHNYVSTLDRKALAEISRHTMVVGAKQLRKALESGRAKRVYLAGNADPAITEPIEVMCQQYHIECAWVPNMLDLGKACGIEVGAAAAAAVD